MPMGIYIVGIIPKVPMCVFYVFEKNDFEVQRLIAKFNSGKLNKFM